MHLDYTFSAITKINLISHILETINRYMYNLLNNFLRKLIIRALGVNYLAN